MNQNTKDSEKNADNGKTGDTIDLTFERHSVVSDDDVFCLDNAKSQTATADAEPCPTNDQTTANNQPDNDVIFNESEDKIEEVQKNDSNHDDKYEKKVIA